VPLDPNFPAIDLVWKSWNQILGVKVHVSTQKDVAQDFINLCNTAKWFTRYDKVHLIYLRPVKAAMKKVFKWVDQPQQELERPSTRGSKRTASGAKQYFLHKRAIHKDSIDCLRDLQRN
jgi:hypothetical protein